MNWELLEWEWKLMEWEGKHRTMGEAALLPTENSSWTFEHLGEDSGLDLKLQRGDFPLHEQGGTNLGCSRCSRKPNPPNPGIFQQNSHDPFPLLSEPGQAGLVLQGQPWNPLAEEAVREQGCAPRQPRG